MFNERLRELRSKKNYSQAALAKELFVSQQTIGNWESGKREPNFETAQKIADFFNVSTDYLLGRTDSHREKQDLDAELEGIEFALFGEVKDMTEAQKQDVLRFAQFVKQQEAQKK